MEDQEKRTKKFAVLALFVAIVVVVSVALWEYTLRDYFAETNGGKVEYKIDIWRGGQKVGHISMSELEELPTVSYLDTLGSGAMDEGPTLRDAILLRVDESSLTGDNAIFIRSDLTGEERTLPWGEISNISKSYILDFTNRGTTKFTSPETEKKDRVRDVTLIRIGA